MSGHTPLVLGATVSLKGDVTQNRWVGARSARELERSLGFGAGRLAQGWTVLLLKQTLQPGDFKFSGLTLRSGGRYGLPADTSAADQLRPSVHDGVMRERGPAGYAELQRIVLAEVKPTGPSRLVKVLPVTPHSKTMAPDEQYPMGGGGLQWTLIRPCAFLVAMIVDQNGNATIASTPPYSTFLGESATLDDRMRVARFLDQA
jgi:hypothetical protein